jgi:5-hydroxyisourate hydrolase
MSGLTTHILDLASGRPAADAAIRLLERAGDGWSLVASARADADGRARLLQGGELAPQSYRLEFDIGPYFRAAGVAHAEPAFLETVVVDFNVADPAAHYHVPLLVSPFGYSTYRGS